MGLACSGTPMLKRVPCGRKPYELLGSSRDSKEVAIPMENFVIREKGFFRRDLPESHRSATFGSLRHERQADPCGVRAAEESLPYGRNLAK